MLETANIQHSHEFDLAEAYSWACAVLGISTC